MKLNIGVLLGALFVSFVFPLATMAEEVIIADQNGCKAVNFYPEPNETVTWTGACKDGFMDGDGVMTWFENNRLTGRYEGHMRHGMADGKGTHTRDSSTYTGDWKHGLQDGNGRYDAADGGWYEGQWKEGQPHGHGQYQNPAGRLFKGEWVDGIYEGDGVSNEEK